MCPVRIESRAVWQRVCGLHMIQTGHMSGLFPLMFLSSMADQIYGSPENWPIRSTVLQSPLDRVSSNTSHAHNQAPSPSASEPPSPPAFAK